MKLRDMLRTAGRAVFGSADQAPPPYLRQFEVTASSAGGRRNSLRTPVAAKLDDYQSTVPQYPTFSARTVPIVGYRANAVFRRCVDLLMGESAQAELQVVERSTGKPVPQHGLTVAFNRGSARSTGKRLLRNTVRDLFNTGNAFWEKARNGLGEVVEYWRLDPQRIAIEPDPVHVVRRFLYQVGGKWWPIDVRDVVHWRFDDPLQPYFGIPPILSAFRDLAVDNELVDYFKVTIQNLGVPPIVVYTEEELDGEEITEARKRWKDRFWGDKRGEPAFLSGTQKLQVVGLDLEKMAIGELVSTSETRIAMVHGVPMILLGRSGTQGDPTRANYREAREDFVVSTVSSLLDELADELSHAGLRDFPNPEQFLVGFNTSRIAVLQEARLRRAKDAAAIFEKGLVSRGTAQTLADIHRHGPDVFYRPTGVDAVLPADATEEVLDPPDEV